MARAEDFITNEGSEARVLATLVVHPNYCLFSEQLKPAHFSNTANSYLYTALCTLGERGIERADANNIVEALISNEATRVSAPDILPDDQIREFVERSEGIARNNREEYELVVENVLDTAFRRDMLSALRSCEELCRKSEEEEIRQKVYRAIDDVVSGYSYKDKFQTYDEVVEKAWEEIKERQSNGFSGIEFKFQALNEYVTIEKGELVIFAAQQKVGKSIMLLNCAVNLLRQKYSVLYIDSELSTRLFTARLLSHLSGVRYRDLTSGHYTEEELERINAAVETMKHNKFTHVYMPFFNRDEIFTIIKRVNNVQPLDVVIVDYFKATGNDFDAYTTYAEMGRCVDMIKNEVAGSMNIAAIGAAQATINNKLADSAKIARNASTIIMLVDKTPEEIEADGAECGNKKMIVTVNRNGMQHAPGEYIDLVFDGDHILYEQAPKQHQPQNPF